MNIRSKAGWSLAWVWRACSCLLYYFTVIKMRKAEGVAHVGGRAVVLVMVMVVVVVVVRFI